MGGRGEAALQPSARVQAQDSASYCSHLLDAEEEEELQNVRRARDACAMRYAYAAAAAPMQRSAIDRVDRLYTISQLPLNIDQQIQLPLVPITAAAFWSGLSKPWLNLAKKTDFMHLFIYNVSALWILNPT